MPLPVTDAPGAGRDVSAVALLPATGIYWPLQAMHRALAILVTLLAGCAFDLGGLQLLPCLDNSDCPPDQECSDSKCVGRACTRPADCGTAQEFRCEGGTCLVIACDGDADCGADFICGADGYCWIRECDPTPEGPPGSPSCADGLDNDCDHKIDGDDPGCQACQEDADCDDGKPCNGIERCVDFACAEGTPVACTPPATPCRTAVCDDTITTGNPCILLPVDDGVACDDDDACTEDDHCTSGNCAGTPKDCSDGATCTVDFCNPVDGSCVNTPNDSLCGTAEVCKPTCFAAASGCGVPPPSVSVSCQTPAPAASGTTCTVDLAGTGGQAACVECVARTGVVVPVFSDFDNGYGGCALDGWSFASTSPCNDTNSEWCVTGFAGTPALQVDKNSCSGKTAIVERTVDTSGLQRVLFCFSYADRGAAAGNDYLAVEYDPSGTGASLTRLFYDVDGPLPGVDDTWLRYCIELPADAVGRPSLLIRVSLHSNDNDQRIFADRFSVIGYRPGCVLSNSPFTSTFAGCSATGWTVTGSVQCPGFLGDALEASGAAKSWTLERTVDTTLLQGDLVLRFDLAEDGTTKDDAFAFDLNATGTWRTLFHQTGALRADQGATTFLVNLSALEPAAIGNPTLKLRFTADSLANGHKIDLDNVSLTAYTGTCSAGTVVLGAPSDTGGGRYAVTATSSVPLPVEIVCSWDGEAARTDAATVQFVP